MSKIMIFVASILFLNIVTGCSHKDSTLPASSSQNITINDNKGPSATPNLTDTVKPDESESSSTKIRTSNPNNSDPSASMSIDFPKPSSVPQGATLVFSYSKDSKGWLIYSTYNSGEPSLSTFYSSDKGSSWKSSVLIIDQDFTQKISENNIFVSLSKRDGKDILWVLLTSDPSAGLMQKKLYLATEDLDAWSLITDVSNVIDGYVTGISFIDGKRGWITASYHGKILVPLYRTTDGGKNWTLQNIKIPAGYNYGNVYPPQFSSNNLKNGTLKVEFIGDNQKSVYMYKSNDFGAHWTR